VEYQNPHENILGPEWDDVPDLDLIERYLPSCQVGNIRLSGHAINKHGLTLLLEIQSAPGVPSIMYPLEPYDVVAEFRAMLAHPLPPKPGNDWNGKHFYAFRAQHDSSLIYWRGRPHAITISVTNEQWEDIRAVFDEAFSRPEYARVWIRLCAARGGR